MTKHFFRRIAHLFPTLKYELHRAGMHETTENFVKRAFMLALYSSFGFGLFFFLILSKTSISLWYVPLIMIGGLLLIFRFIIATPSAYIKKRGGQIDKEIIFTGRALIIQLDSGISLFNAMTSVAKGTGIIAEEFRTIVTKVKMGTHIEKALDEAVEETSSENLRRLIWQILNSLKTGSDVTEALSAVLEQISREQIIQVETYGRKLNPLAMFYMMIAVILPSLGITIGLILVSMVGVEIPMIILVSIALFMGFVQFMFISMVKNIRPPVEM